MTFRKMCLVIYIVYTCTYNIPEVRIVDQTIRIRKCGVKKQISAENGFLRMLFMARKRN